jgi:hypothetical protein
MGEKDLRHGLRPREDPRSSRCQQHPDLAGGDRMSEEWCVDGRTRKQSKGACYSGSGCLVLGMEHLRSGGARPGAIAVPGIDRPRTQGKRESVSLYIVEIAIARDWFDRFPRRVIRNSAGSHESIYWLHGTF